MERSRLNLVLGIVTVVALAFAAWMYTANKSLRDDLEGAQAARRALEVNALATGERVSVAENAKATAENAVAGLKAQLADAEKVKAAAELSLKQLQERH